MLSHMIEPRCLIKADDTGRLFPGIFRDWKKGFVPAVELFRGPGPMKQLHGLAIGGLDVASALVAGQFAHF